MAGDRDRRITIHVSEDEHNAWAGAAFEESVSLSEYMRRGANHRLVNNAPSTDPDGLSANTIRSLIRHFQAMLRVIEDAPKQELGIVTGILCLGACCHKSEHLHQMLGNLPL